MKRDVGRLGESVLRQWAAQAGVILNSSGDQDATGWDFLLEWPTEDHNRASGRITLDRQPSPLQCLIQVKSTDQGRQRCSVKLSNWFRMVRTPLPTFFLVLVFAGEDECQDAYLVHVGEREIRKTLERIRKVSVEQGRATLNKYTLDLSWGENDRLPSFGGACLEQAVRRYVHGSLEDYVKEKLELVNTVGYEEQISEIKVQLRAPEGWSGDPEDLLVDFLLGLVPHLEIESGEMTDVRFGIPSPEPEHTFAKGMRLQIGSQASAGKGEIRFRAPHINREVRITADTLLPRGAAGLIDEQRVRARFRAPFVDFVFGLQPAQPVNFKLSIPPLSPV